MADLPVLSQMLSQLFESSQCLNDIALHHLIDALCKLSHEAMELAYANRVTKYYILVFYLNPYMDLLLLGALLIRRRKTTRNRAGEYATH